MAVIKYNEDEFNDALNYVTNGASTINSANTDASYSLPSNPSWISGVITSTLSGLSNIKSDLGQILYFFDELGIDIKAANETEDRILSMLYGTNELVDLFKVDYSNLTPGTHWIVIPSENPDDKIILRVYIPEEINDDTKMGVMFHSGNVSIREENNEYKYRIDVGGGSYNITDGNKKGISYFYNMMNDNAEKPGNAILVEVLGSDSVVKSMRYIDGDKQTLNNAILTRQKISNQIQNLKDTYGIKTENTVGIGHSVASYTGLAMEFENPGVFGEYHVAGAAGDTNGDLNVYIENLTNNTNITNDVLHENLNNSETNIFMHAGPNNDKGGLNPDHKVLHEVYTEAGKEHEYEPGFVMSNSDNRYSSSSSENIGIHTVYHKNNKGADVGHGSVEEYAIKTAFGYDIGEKI